METKLERNTAASGACVKASEPEGFGVGSTAGGGEINFGLAISDFGFECERSE
ncbi:MAG: hypothetical protein IH595_11685 [Bacteroidales bacterium]|nr:hypothetical protein [Bacteroidales bacterium]